MTCDASREVPAIKELRPLLTTLGINFLISTRMPREPGGRKKDLLSCNQLIYVGLEQFMEF